MAHYITAEVLDITKGKLDSNVIGTMTFSSDDHDATVLYYALDIEFINKGKEPHGITYLLSKAECCSGITRAQARSFEIRDFLIRCVRKINNGERVVLRFR